MFVIYERKIHCVPTYVYLLCERPWKTKFLYPLNAKLKKKSSSNINTSINITKTLIPFVSYFIIKIIVFSLLQACKIIRKK